MSISTVSETKMFGGDVRYLKHASEACGCDMTFSVFLPPQAAAGKPLPVVWWLSGLTCTAENFTTKAGAQRDAAELGLIVIAPDTSPRGEGVADDEAYDLGQGAGFYLNATREPWSHHFRMYDYIVEELPALVSANLPVDLNRQGIFGHSMGGHGALTIALKNPGRFKSVSAFSPISSPARVPWGQKAFAAYLGEERNDWEAYDATCLVADAEERLPILIDQGRADNFLEEQLRPEIFQAACDDAGHPLELRLHDGYDHSYHFIATFMPDHLKHHAQALC